MLRVGVDVGGTFTDIFVYEEENGEIRSAKVLTTPENQAIGVMRSLETAGVRPAEIAFVAHGTTTGTNALIERKGAVTGLLTTEGFRDVLEIMRTDRATGYDLAWEKPRPLVPCRLRREVSERVDKTGAVEAPIDDGQARTAIRELIDRGVESIAVSFIHAHANPEHEQRTRDLILEQSPDLMGVSHVTVFGSGLCVPLLAKGAGQCPPVRSSDNHPAARNARYDVRNMSAAIFASSDLRRTLYFRSSRVIWNLTVWGLR